MSLGAKLYTVKGTYGTSHIIHELATGAFFTERSEETARAMAKEKGLTITEQRTMSRDEWLRLNGQEPMRVAEKKPAKKSEEQTPAKPTPPQPILSRAKFDTSWPATGPLDLPLTTSVPQDDSVIVQTRGTSVPERRPATGLQSGVFNRSAKGFVPPPMPADLLTGRAELTPKNEARE